MRWRHGKVGTLYCNLHHAAHHSVTEINLSELQKTLDAQGIELVENQKESVVGRKALADRTKGMFLPRLCASVSLKPAP